MKGTEQENKILLKFKEKIVSRKTNVTKKEIEELGINTSLLPKEYGNVILYRDFLGDFELKIKNELHDLNGNPISENRKLLQILKANYESNKKEIKFEDLHKLDIWTPKSELIIGNFRLKSFLTSSYQIDLVDKNKSVDNLWKDEVIDKDKIYDTINKFNLSEKDILSLNEIELNKKLELHFKNFFATVKKGGTSNKGLVDLILGDNKYGIEIKLGRELKKTDKTDRAYGQAERYREEFKNNFMLLIAGTIEDKKEKALQDLLKKLKEKSILFYFIEAH